MIVSKELTISSYIRTGVLLMFSPIPNRIRFIRRLLTFAGIYIPPSSRSIFQANGPALGKLRSLRLKIQTQTQAKAFVQKLLLSGLCIVIVVLVLLFFLAPTAQVQTQNISFDSTATNSGFYSANVSSPTL